MSPLSPISPIAEGEEKPEKGLFPLSVDSSVKSSLDIDERTPSTNIEERSLMQDTTVVSKLISAVKNQGHVIPEWPVLFLERHQVPHDEAINVVKGLRLAGKLVQRSDDSWEAPN